MANQVQVSTTGNIVVQVAPPPNVSVTVSRTAIGQISNVPTANYANYANIANIANVANSVNVSNVVGIGNIAVLNLDGNAGNILYGNGVFSAVPNTAYSNNSNYANFAGTAFNVSGSNVVGQVANANYAGLSGSAITVAGPNVTGTVANANFATTAGTAISVPAANISGTVANASHAIVADSANSVAGSNVSGQVSYAAVANSVAGSNVSGQVNYAAIANSVAGANVTGYVANATHSNVADVANSVSAANVVGTVANANYATYSGTSFNVSGSNVVGYVSDANHATVSDSANSVAGANVSGYVANATHANVADVANSVAGANVTGQVANALVAGTVYTANQPNITSVGTLSSLSVSGNSNIGQLNISGNATATGNITASFFLGNVIGNISGNLVVPGTNTSVLYNDDGNAGASSNFTFNEATNVVTVIGNIQANYFIGDGSQLSNINGGNISNVGNANYANYAGTAYNVSGSNVSGQVANALVAGTVYTNAQPNITSVGNLTSLTVTGNATIGNIVNLDSLTFDTANVGPGAVAQLTWNDGQGTLDLGLKGGNVTARLAEQEYARVYNSEATALVKGEVVYIFGAQGNLISVKRAQANVEATSVGTLGIVAETISAGGEGFIQTTGAMYKLNTNGLIAGNPIYLSPSIPGGYTQTKPVAPNQLVTLGYVERISNTVGSIYIKVDNGYELDELHNVLITTPTAGQALVYNSSNLWVNGNPNIANIAYSVDGANVNGYVANANHANIADVANTAYSVDAANISGTVANANYATYAGTAYSVSGANVSGEVANANYATYAGTAYSISGSNISGEVANANYATFAGTAYSISGSNVTSEVANANFATHSGTANIANTAYSVNVSNVVGIGNIATTNYDGNAANILHGDGSWGPEAGNLNANYANFAGTAFNVSGSNVSGEVANANYATYAGTAYSVSGANVSGDVSGANHANIADVANSVSGSNVSGDVSGANHANVADTANSVSVGNVTGIGNIATVNLTGSTSNVLYGNGVFAAIPTDDANFANYAGNVTVSAQPNITSTGNLVSLTVNNGNVSLPTVQFDPNGILVGPTGNALTSAPNSYVVTIDYGNGQGDGNVLFPKTQAFVKARGNSTNMLTANAQDRISRTQYMLYNGTSNVLAGQMTVRANSAFNSNSNGVMTAGQFTFATGNPNGDVNNINAVSGTNNLIFDQGGRLTFVPGASIGSAIWQQINTFGNAVGGNGSGTQNIFWNRARGNADSVLSVQPNDQLGGFIFSGHNGTSYFNTRSPVIRASVDSSYVANTTAIPAGLQFAVCDNTTSYTHNFYANGNVTLSSGKTLTAGYFTGDGSNLSSITGANVTGQVGYAAIANSVAVANVSGIGNIATVNLDGNASNILYGNGVFSGAPSTANANYANFAGDVVNSSQANITSLGNLINLNINNGVAGLPTKQFDPNGISIGSTANSNLMANSSLVDIDYGNGQGGGNVLLGKSTTYLKARGNASSLVAANVSDRVGRTNYMFYNGTANVLAAATQVNPGSGVTFNTNANAITTAGQYVIITGNPNGDQGNANALSNQNLYTFDPFGRLTITQGAAGTTSVGLQINTYGGSGGNGSATTQNMFFTRARGNRDGALSVQPSDQLGGFLFAGHNGTATFSTRTPIIRAVVDSSYVANTANIPAGLQFVVCDNTTSYTHNFYANGNVALNSGKTFTSGELSATGNITGGNLSVSGNVTASNFIGNVTIGNTINSTQITLNPTSAGSPFLYINGNSAGANTGALQLTDSGLTINVDGDNYPGGAPIFAFSTYQTGNGAIPPQFYKRYKGTSTSPSGVVSGDQILNEYYQVYGDSGNTNMTLGGVIAGVGTVYSPGNISFNYNIYSQGNPNDLLTLSFPNVSVGGNITATSKTITAGYFVGDGSNLTNITANTANYATNVTGASQGNITSVGTLTGLTVSGTANIANLQLQQFQETEYSIGTTSGTITPDFNNGSIQTMTLNGNITMNSLGNAIAGRSMTLVITQDGTGGRTLSSTMKFAGGNKTLSTAAGAVDIISIFYTGSTYYASLTTGYA